MSLLILCVISFVLAFVAAMPILGPIAVLVVSRGVEGRFTEARKIGIGAALAEGTYAGLAYATFSTFFARNPAAVPVSRSLTVIVFIVIGVSCLRFKPRPLGEKREPDEKSRTGFALGFLTSAFNPAIFLTWTAAATAIYSRQIADMKPIYAVPFGISAAVGIVSWYVVLLRLMTHYHSRLPQRFIGGIIRGMGALLIVVAVWTAIGVVRSLL